MARRTFNRPIARSARLERTWLDEAYDSKLEMRRAVELEILRRAGHIRNWYRQVPVQLGRDTRTRIDFLVTGLEYDWFEEPKGFDTPAFRIIKGLWLKYGPTQLHIFYPKGKSNWRIEVLARGSEART